MISRVSAARLLMAEKALPDAKGIETLGCVPCQTSRWMSEKALPDAKGIETVNVSNRELGAVRNSTEKALPDAKGIETHSRARCL